MEMQEAGRKRDRTGEAADRRQTDPEQDRKKQAAAEKFAAAAAAAAEEFAAWERRMAEADAHPNRKLMEEDIDAFMASEFRKGWDSLWAGTYGSFDDTTPIPPMRFTDGPLPQHATTTPAMQVFSVRVAGTRGDLQWPLHVFGMVAARDPVDRNRNVVFNRTRDNCQTLTQQESCLVLTGPSRAVVWLDSVSFDVVLKVKGNTESEDKVLSFLAAGFQYPNALYSSVIDSSYTSGLCTLEFTLAQINGSVEATISVHVIKGKWPDGFHGLFTAQTTSIKDKEVVLLDSGDDQQMPVNDDGMIMLSRRVVSVEIMGTLKISVEAWHSDNKIECINKTEAEGVHTPKKKEVVKGFTPKRKGRSRKTFNVGSGKMEIVVAWSMLSLFRGNYRTDKSVKAS